MNLEQADEAELVIAAVKLDPEAFGELVRRAGPELGRIVRSKMGASEIRGVSVQDVLQTAYLRAWRTVENYEDRGRPFVAWLTTICANVVIDLLKSATVRRELLNDPDLAPPEPEVPPEQLPEGRVLARSEFDELARVLNSGRIPAAHREVLLRRFYLNQPVRQVAQAMGSKENSVKALTFRAVRSVRREMAPDQRLR